MAEFITTGSGVPTNAFFEPTHRAGSHLLWEADLTYSRKVITIDNSEGMAPIVAGTVIANAEGEFQGILEGFPVPVGAVQDRTVNHRDCVVRDEKLVFPTVASVVADPDAVPPVAAVDGPAETAALETLLRDQMAAAGIEIQ